MTNHPVAVIGAGPIGLAAAAHLVERGENVVVLESGHQAAAAVREWAHIRLFSAWSELIDPAAERLLSRTGWRSPDTTAYPTGGEWAEAYLQPLADALGEYVRYEHRVVGIARSGRDLVVDAGRGDTAYSLHVATPAGETRIRVRAVIDASGTWSRPNPLGADGLPTIGEATYADRICYRVPDLSDADVRARYAGRHIAVAGTGASAKTAVVNLLRLAESAPETSISWIIRRPGAEQAFGGEDADQLVERGALAKRAREATHSDAIRTVTGFRTVAVTEYVGKLRLEADDGRRLDNVDDLVVLTGFRPDLAPLSEIRLELDPVLQAPRALAPMIDPNVHSCGTVEPHGAAELAHPETDFYLAGIKSYGRATSFLALTGYEQVRSIAAHLTGDHEAAAQVELSLPETGVCGGAATFDSAPADGCCGAAPDGPAPIALSSPSST